MITGLSYSAFETAMVAGVVLGAAGYAFKRWWPRRRDASQGAGCASGCGGGACHRCDGPTAHDAPPAPPPLRPVRVMRRP